MYCARAHTSYVADCSRSKLGRFLVVLKSSVGCSSPLLLSVSNRRSRGKCSTYYLVSVTSARWWISVGSPCLPPRCVHDTFLTQAHPADEFKVQP